MNIETGREFCYTNPQDDPHLYTPSYYGLEAKLRATPTQQPTWRQPGYKPEDRWRGVEGGRETQPALPTKDKHHCCWPWLGRNCWPWLGRK
jgi:hypothetical protein